ncbi:hypothetical protein PTRA_a1755 [Pseudoalteromonas translucida KMM 520]|uniref:Uncharacterized protein n=1 Tax=Pseudoalteromonas translucida KMM 520 TaxID=1315283 RepID=A0A0U2LMQ5_9GAMM|nr:hypothetical protein PTRA_a1755 [Pseudoalteromonas translucida KMM 520]
MRSFKYQAITSFFSYLFSFSNCALYFYIVKVNKNAPHRCFIFKQQ